MLNNSILIILLLSLILHGFFMVYWGNGRYPFPRSFRLFIKIQALLLFINLIHIWGWLWGNIVSILLVIFSATILFPAVAFLHFIDGRNITAGRIGDPSIYKWTALASILNLLWQLLILSLFILTIASFL
jgi:hypothetical protein